VHTDAKQQMCFGLRKRTLGLGRKNTHTFSPSFSTFSHLLDCTTLFPSSHCFPASQPAEQHKTQSPIGNLNCSIFAHCSGQATISLSFAMPFRLIVSPNLSLASIQASKCANVRRKLQPIHRAWLPTKRLPNCNCRQPIVAKSITQLFPPNFLEISRILHPNGAN